MMLVVHGAIPFARRAFASACTAREQWVLTLPSEQPMAMAAPLTSGTLIVFVLYLVYVELIQVNAASVDKKRVSEFSMFLFLKRPVEVKPAAAPTPTAPAAAKK